MIKFLTTLTLILVSTLGWAAPLPTHSPVPGGIYLLELGDIAQAKPEAYFKNKRVMIAQNDNHWVAVIGIPLSTKPGEYKVSTKNDQDKQNHVISIKDKKYESQYITVKNKRHVTPNEQDLARIRSEKKEIVAALANWRESPDATVSLNLPVEGPLTSPFGLRRYFNEQPRKPHSGIDIAAERGTPILAPADGVITEAGEYFFNGNTLFIDHGQGLITMYCHMDSIAVEPGKVVKKGEVIGTIGSTGRATGPHLHWGVSLNDARIDPSLITPQLQPKQ